MPWRNTELHASMLLLERKDGCYPFEFDVLTKVTEKDFADRNHYEILGQTYSVLRIQPNACIASLSNR